MLHIIEEIKGKCLDDIGLIRGIFVLLASIDLHECIVLNENFSEDCLGKLVSDIYYDFTNFAHAFHIMIR